MFRIGEDEYTSLPVVAANEVIKVHRRDCTGRRPSRFTAHHRRARRPYHCRERGVQFRGERRGEQQAGDEELVYHPHGQDAVGGSAGAVVLC